MTVLLGVDLGGSSTKVVLQAGSTVRDQRVLPGRLTADGLPGLAAALRESAAGDEIAGVGVTVPGILDDTTGVVRRSVNLPWLDGRDVAAEVSALVGAPAVALHDGRAAALAEAVLGAGRGTRDVYVLTLGTGVAGAHVVDGSARPGAHGAAGEIGHVSLDPEGLPCGCGQRGCLETVVGAPSLLRRWQQRTGRTGGAVSAISAAADAGDPDARAVLDEAGAALATALLGLVAVLDPGLVVLGGGVGESGVLRARVEDGLRARATFHVVPPVVPAGLGRWAGARGAALAAGRVVVAG